MLIGRNDELDQIAALLAGARGGHGGGILLRGDPGIGKTAILGWARDRPGFTTISATGVEAEAQLPFAALGAALRPILHHRPALAPAQRAALEAGLALGPPAAADRFAAYAGVFALLEAAAADGPLLLVVDDAHWLDAPSAEAIAFCARRVEDVPIAILVATRVAEGQPPQLAGVEERGIGPLPPEASRTLLGNRDRASLAPTVAARLLEVAEGNPLALIELPRTLSLDERTGRVALPESLRVGEAITRAFRRRLDVLDESARRGLVVVAAGIEDPVEALLAACGRLGCTVDALEAAEAAGILDIGPGHVTFAHPLLRAVVLDIAPPAEVREAHRALADAVAAERGAERRAWHLAHAAIGVDDAAAGALEQAGGAAAARTAYATAADALARAAELSSDPDTRAARQLQAAGLAQMAGRFPLTAGLLEQAAAAVRDPALSAEIDHLRGLVRVYTGPMDEGIRLLFDSADLVAATSPARAAQMLVDSSMAWGMVGQPEMCIVACRKARLVGHLDEVGRAKLELAMGNSLFFVGRGREVRADAARLASLVPLLDPVSRDHHGVICGAIVQMYCGAFETAQADLDRAIEACRSAGALGPLAFYFATAADLGFRTLRWPEALASAEDAYEIAMETGQIPIAAYALSVLARLEAASGREEACRGHLETSAHLAAASRTDALIVWVGHAHGVLAMGRGDPSEAIAALEPVAAAWDRHAVRCVEAVPWQHDLIEAYVRAGRIGDARRRLRSLAEDSYASAGPQVLALASRCRGLLDSDYERHMEEALAHHARLPIPFDVARTRLLYGERLRRDRRRGRAREQLELALAGFEALGALPWARRTREELLATGSRAPDAGSSPMASLTPRELQVAVTISRGATNREAAAALFLSEKTIERHLSAVYAKLGLRSRTELARLLARDDRGIPPISPAPGSS